MALLDGGSRHSSTRRPAYIVMDTNTVIPLTINDPAAEANWRLSAVCAQTDPELFFPDKGGSAKPAKRICAQCPVRVQCLDWAQATQQSDGIYGGFSTLERRKLRHAAAAAAAAA